MIATINWDTRPSPAPRCATFVYAGDQLVALLGFRASARRLVPRDWHIGWSGEKRKQNSNLAISNSRFLILPWIESKNLASKILSRTRKRIADDWEARYNYRPVLIESFIEKQRFNGTCYKAANWIWVGTTKERGRADRQKEEKLPRKEILLDPLELDYIKILALLPEFGHWDNRMLTSVGWKLLLLTEVIS